MGFGQRQTMPPKPPNKTKTEPGLGQGGAVPAQNPGSHLPRMDSAEMRRVRDNFRRSTDETHEYGAPRSKADSSPGEPSPGTADAIPDSQPTGRRLRDSVRREDPDDDDPAESRVAANRSDRIGGSVSAKSSDRTNGGKKPAWEPEASTGTRQRVGHSRQPGTPSTGPASSPKPPITSNAPGANRSRPPVTVDDVGAAAVKLARTTRRESAPKLVASRAMIAKAPIDTRAAFVLSLVDGRNSINAIVDMSGMVEDEVKAILERLARLGLISLP